MEKIKKRYRLHTLALALTFVGTGILTSPTANALAIISTYNFTGTASVTDSEGGIKSTNNNASLGTTSVSQFDSSQGVLTGVTVKLTSTQTLNTNVTANALNSTGANSNVISSGTAISKVKLEGSGISYPSGDLSGSDTCAGKKKDACNDGAHSANQNVSTTDSPGNLDSYTGTGNVTFNHTALTLEATQGTGVFNGAESTTGDVTWAGKLEVTYDYLLHAVPSFTNGSTPELVLDVDFGSLQIGESATQSFDIFNLANINRIGLDFDSFFETDSDDKFSISGLAFTGLAQGLSSSGLLTFDTSSAGSFAASYLLNLSDANIGAASSWHNYQLRLNVRGQVDEGSLSTLQVNDVPEPGLLALMSIGLFSLLGLARRKQQVSI